MTANPFVRNNTPVNKGQFIGREDEIENPDFTNIKDHIFQNTSPTNLAIVGIPRVGKSSLVLNAIANRENDLYDQKKVLTIQIDFSLYRNSTEFFCSLVHRCEEKMKSKDCYKSDVLNAAEKVHQEAAENSQYNIDSIQAFFSEVGRTDHHLLFILDKFDHAPKIFEDEQDFYRLRELARRSEISFVLIANRCIDVIEQEARSSSPFHQLFEPPVRLAMFSNDDLDSYFSKFDIVGIQISENDRGKILHYCGYHPNLLQLLGYHIANSHASKKAFDVDKIFQDTLRGYVDNYYNQLCEFLKAIKLLQPLHQILSGNTIDSDPEDELKRYGLIQKDANGSYAAYSKHFQEYLKANRKKFRDNYKSSEQNQTPEDSVSSVVPAESLAEFERLKITWSETEEAFREIITTAMSRQFGDAWIEEVVEIYAIFQTIIGKCRKRKQDQEGKSSGNVELSESNLFGFTMTSELFDAILDNTLWNNFFQRIFGKNWNYWKERQEFIVPIGRRLTEHNNKENFLDDQKLTFAGYCEEILRIRGEFEKSVNTVQDEPTVVSTPGTVTGTPPSVPTGKQKGRINFISDRGFGRITPNTCSSDHVDGIYVHVSECSELMDLQEGQEVEFEIQNTYKGWNAKNVSLV